MVARGENSGEKAEYILFVALSFYLANLMAVSSVKEKLSKPIIFGARHFNLH